MKLTGNQTVLGSGFAGFAGLRFGCLARKFQES